MNNFESVMEDGVGSCCVVGVMCVVRGGVDGAREKDGSGENGIFVLG